LQIAIFLVALLVATDLDLSQSFTAKELLVDSSVSSVEQLYAVRRDTIGAGGIMFCDGCGAAVQRCNRARHFVVAVESKSWVPSPHWEPRAGRVQGHVHLLGILGLAISAFHTIAGVILYVLGTLATSNIGWWGGCLCE
jgi:hypothetical protein